MSRADDRMQSCRERLNPLLGADLLREVLEAGADFLGYNRKIQIRRFLRAGGFSFDRRERTTVRLRRVRFAWEKIFSRGPLRFGAGLFPRIPPLAEPTDFYKDYCDD